MNVTRRSGFTLIEMLAVILILGILLTFLVPKLLGASQAALMNSTRAFLQQIDGRVKDYEGERGDFPPSTFPRDLDPKPSAANMGIEMLVISLWPAEGAYQAAEVAEERLGNTDGDHTGTSLTSFTNAEAFELFDDWDNPIAYIHSRDYDEVFHYTTFGEDGTPIENDVRAVVSSKTGDPMNKRSFQLLSAGPDLVFGTDDDIANFAREDSAP